MKKKYLLLILVPVVLAGIAALAVFVRAERSGVSVGNLSGVYDASQIVCRGSAQPICAAQAAERAQLPIAWTRLRGARQYMMVVPKIGLSTQELETDDYLISIMSGAVKAGPGKTIRKLRTDGISGDMLLDQDRSAGYWGISVTWRVNEVSYLISVTLRRPGLEPALSFAEKLFENIEYVRPA